MVSHEFRQVGLTGLVQGRESPRRSVVKSSIHDLAEIAPSLGLGNWVCVVEFDDGSLGDYVLLFGLSLKKFHSLRSTIPSHPRVPHCLFL